MRAEIAAAVVKRYCQTWPLLGTVLNGFNHHFVLTDLVELVLSIAVLRNIVK